MDKTLAVLNKFCSNWQEKIKLGKKYNSPLSLGFNDGEFELLSCVENNLMGTGSISHGYDHTNKDETKGTSWIQPKKCKKCESKLHFFSEKCSCDSSDMEYINDSRWGIDVVAHFKYQLQNYRLWFLYTDKFNFDCNTFYLNQFVINSDNINFQKILKVQESRSDSRYKNFLPNSSDFYACNPVEESSFKINFDEIHGTIVERLSTNQIIYTQEIIKKMNKIIDLNLLPKKDTYQYEELLPHINIEGKKTSHGKNRGITNRRIK
jgi:hypothetical protein